MFALLPDGALPDRRGLRLKDVRERGNWIAVSGLVAADTMTAAREAGSGDGRGGGSSDGGSGNGGGSSDGERSVAYSERERRRRLPAR